MNIVLWILFGALVGWLAGIMMSTSMRQGMLLSIVVGIIGAVIGGWLFSRSLSPDQFSAGSLAAALLGSTILLSFLYLATRGRIS